MQKKNARLVNKKKIALENYQTKQNNQTNKQRKSDVNARSITYSDLPVKSDL